MSKKKPYIAISFYHFFEVVNPQAEVDFHKAFIQHRDITSRIYISGEGINGQMSASQKDGEAYMEWLQSRKEYEGVSFKVQEWDEQVFPRKCIKYRKNLVGYDEKIDLSNRGEHLDPIKWKEMLENDDKHVLIDVRNDYEWKVGHFENAELPACKTFREFQTYADNLKNSVDPKKTPVMMYCTGGIRCELYSSILKDKGFDNVYQLDGGVINYGQKVGQDHWLGKLFVFDDRMVVPVDENDDTNTISSCHFCETKNDQYYNCANMDCNKLFLCCEKCLKAYAGCCKEDCTHSARVRPYKHQNAHKPFRKWHQYFSEKKANAT